MGEPEGGFELCERYEVTGESAPYVALVFPAHFPFEGDTSMKRQRFSTEQIVSVLKQAETRDAGGGSDPAGRDNRTNIA